MEWYDGIKQWKIKPSTTIIRGRAAAQYEYGAQYKGGAEQILFFSPGNMGLYYE